MIEKNNLRTQEDIEKEAQEYMSSHTKQDFIKEIKRLASTNPLLYMIIISVLKLMELQIISNEEADDLLQKVAPYEEHLIKDYFTTQHKHDAK